MPTKPFPFCQPAEKPGGRPWPRPTPALVRLVLALGGAPSLQAGGTPPLITDDPGTPGAGRWEFNLGVSTERRAGRRISELPALELNYGVGEVGQFKYAVPRLSQSEGGQARVSGTGNSILGFKWRMHDPGDDGLAFSFHPQLEFTPPGSSSRERGLVEPGTATLLPVQLERRFGHVIVNLELGRDFRRTGDAWFYGAALRRRLHEKFEIAAEFVGAAAADFGRSHLTVNFSFAVDVSALSSLLVSLGRELHNHNEPGATVVGYVGWQLRL